VSPFSHQLKECFTVLPTACLDKRQPLLRKLDSTANLIHALDIDIDKTMFVGFKCMRERMTPPRLSLVVRW
jgi:hypothetical protein